MKGSLLLFSVKNCFDRSFIQKYNAGKKRGMISPFELFFLSSEYLSGTVLH